MASVFDSYAPMKGEIQRRNSGSLVSFETGESVTYGLYNAQERGVLFIGAGVPVYAGMVVGETPKQEDISVNMTSCWRSLPNPCACASACWTTRPACARPPRKRADCRNMISAPGACSGGGFQSAGETTTPRSRALPGRRSRRGPCWPPCRTGGTGPGPPGRPSPPPCPPPARGGGAPAWPP